MELTTLALFILSFTSILILPGPNSAFAVGQSLKFGISSSVAVPLGFMSATGIHAFFVFSGVGFIVQKVSIVLVVLKWFGVIYLLWLTYKSFTAKSSKVNITPQEFSKLKMYVSAMLLSLTNPKALLASLMLYPLFLDAEHSYISQAITLSLTAMTISFLVYSLYSLTASALQKKLTSNKFANKVVGAMYFSAAATLALKSLNQ